MTLFEPLSEPGRSRICHAVTLAAPDDFDGWRDKARRLAQAGVPPEDVVWIEPGAAGSLFSGDAELPRSRPDAPPLRANRAFLDLAKAASCHSDPERFALLYRLLWRLQSSPSLMDDAADADVRRLQELARAVRRDKHKMRAFVRFRTVEEASGERYVAWFEPCHHILRSNASFFVDRFATMRWSILTPRGALHWDGQSLCEGPPAERSDAPAGDPMEDLWKRYYASIFNPARLKVGAMLKEMPRKYWKNMPEAALIPDLVAGAQAREAAMVEKGAALFEAEDRPESLSGIGKAIQACRRCPIGCNGTDAVMGEGPRTATVMVVGEQPGDTEEREGKPFVGPAGRLLDARMEEAGIDRARAYVTNAVKHFKFVPRGKRRLHQSPTAKEIDICRWLLEGEREIVKPQLVLALGASAARGVLGKTVSIQKDRGRPIALEDGAELWIAPHPSYLLRLDGDGRAEQEKLFARDLRKVAARLTEIQEG